GGVGPHEGGSEQDVVADLVPPVHLAVELLGERRVVGRSVVLAELPVAQRGGGAAGHPRYPDAREEPPLRRLSLVALTPPRERQRAREGRRPCVIDDDVADPVPRRLRARPLLLQERLPRLLEERDG